MLEMFSPLTLERIRIKVVKMVSKHLAAVDEARLGIYNVQYALYIISVNAMSRLSAPS